MPRLLKREVRALLKRADAGTTTTERGRAFEDLLCYLFGCVPGVTISKKDVLNTFGSEEIDVAFWNTRQQNGFYFLTHIILAECKNWLNPVGSSEIVSFSEKLKRRAQTYGILFAASGITGDAGQRTAAHDIVRAALNDGRHILVLTRAEVESLVHSRDLVKLLQEKLCELAVLGTVNLSVP
jgi:hypothetical protein